LIDLLRFRSFASERLDDDQVISFDGRCSVGWLRQRCVQVVMEFDNVESIKEGILLGAGVNILPEPVFQKEIALRSLLAIPLDRDDLARHIGLIHRRRKRLPSTVGHFVDMLRNGKD
jgi:DNA-binding transcriptional LysR family regulator